MVYYTVLLCISFELPRANIVGGGVVDVIVLTGVDLGGTMGIYEWING